MLKVRVGPLVMTPGNGWAIGKSGSVNAGGFVSSSVAPGRYEASNEPGVPARCESENAANTRPEPWACGKFLFDMLGMCGGLQSEAAVRPPRSAHHVARAMRAFQPGAVEPSWP